MPSQSVKPLQLDGINTNQVDNDADSDDSYISEHEEKGKKKRAYHQSTRPRKRQRIMQQKMHCHPDNFNKKYVKRFQGKQNITGKEIKDGGEEYVPESEEEEESDEEEESEGEIEEEAESGENSNVSASEEN